MLEERQQPLIDGSQNIKRPLPPNTVMIWGDKAKELLDHGAERLEVESIIGNSDDPSEALSSALSIGCEFTTSPTQDVNYELSAYTKRIPLLIPGLSRKVAFRIPAGSTCWESVVAAAIVEKFSFSPVSLALKSTREGALQSVYILDDALRRYFLDTCLVSRNTFLLLRLTHGSSNSQSWAILYTLCQCTLVNEEHEHTRSFVVHLLREDCSSLFDSINVQDYVFPVKRFSPPTIPVDRVPELTYRNGQLVDPKLRNFDHISSNVSSETHTSSMDFNPDKSDKPWSFPGFADAEPSSPAPRILSANSDWYLNLDFNSEGLLEETEHSMGSPEWGTVFRDSGMNSSPQSLDDPGFVAPRTPQSLSSTEPHMGVFSILDVNIAKLKKVVKAYLRRRKLADNLMDSRWPLVEQLAKLDVPEFETRLQSTSELKAIGKKSLDFLPNNKRRRRSYSRASQSSSTLA